METDFEKIRMPQNDAEQQVKESLESHVQALEQELATQQHLDTLPELEKKYQIKDFNLLISSNIVLGITILFFFLHSFIPALHISLAWIAIVGAMVHILVSGLHDLDEILEKVEFGTLMFFAALFILMETLAELGLIQWIGDQLVGLIETVPEGKSRLGLAVFLILWVSGVASAFIDNIPYTATLVPIIVQISENLHLDMNTLVWALAFGACLGGNGTLIGASANVVAVGLLEKDGFHVSFIDFFKFGAPITFISLVVASIYLLIFHVAIFG